MPMLIPGSARLRAKEAVADLLTAASFVSASERIADALLGPYIRGVSYHETPAEDVQGFDEQIAWLCSRYDPYALSELDQFFNGKPPARRGALLCFDDGPLSNYQHAVPVLERHGARGWFFLVLDLIGTPGYMTSAQARELHERGHVIGCHTRSHPNLARVDSHQKRKEIVQARRELEDLLGFSVRSFLFPFGSTDSYDGLSFQYAVSSYDYVFTSCPGFIRARSSPYNLGRANTEAAWSLHLLQLELSGLSDIRFFRRNLRCRRSIEGG